MADKTTSEQLASEVEALKEDIGRLQKDLTDMLASAGTYSREKLHESHLRIRAALAQVRYQTGQKMSDVYEAALDHGAMAMDKGRRTVEQRPLTSLAIAFGAGVLLSWLSERNRQ